MNNYSIFFLSVAFLLLFVACNTSSQIMNSTKNSATVSSKAVLLAQAQLEAYNQRDLEAFLIPYSDSVKIYNERTFNYEGIDKMRTNYASWFDSLDSLHCQIVNRISTGNTVIDHEHLTYRRKGESKTTTFEAIAIYKVEGDKIQEVTFVRPSWE